MRQRRQSKDTTLSPEFFSKLDHIRIKPPPIRGMRKPSPLSPCQPILTIDFPADQPPAYANCASLIKVREHFGSNFRTNNPTGFTSILVFHVSLLEPYQTWDIRNTNPSNETPTPISPTPPRPPPIVQPRRPIAEILHILRAPDNSLRCFALRTHHRNFWAGHPPLLNSDHEAIVDTDASDFAIAGVVSQISPQDNLLRPIASPIGTAPR
ncbi:hypothetical protein DFS34DRAFT_240111 [Phlyctochytrium arcticum]|nr:hypothetical protein DFS34DRAFT_240111 [Phlyctochytrium arcticum]